MVGSTLSLIISMHLGFTTTLLYGVLAYVVGALALSRSGVSLMGSASLGVVGAVAAGRGPNITRPKSAQ